MNKRQVTVHCWDDSDHPADPLQWRDNERDGVSNHQRINCLRNRLCRRKSKKTSKLRAIDLCMGNSPGVGVHAGILSLLAVVAETTSIILVARLAILDDP